MARIFGIDLGTTNSLIAYVVNGRPVVVRDPDTGVSLLPSVVHWAEDGTVLVGQAAREAEVGATGVTISSVKRLMGIGMEHANEDDRRQFSARRGDLRTTSAQYRRAGRDSAAGIGLRASRVETPRRDRTRGRGDRRRHHRAGVF